jgi:xanthine dehydrogenase accessory factor
MDIYGEIAERQKAGQAFVLATIVRVSGSSPRKAGAKMLVFADGTISGTIGGGNFETLVIGDCVDLLASHSGTLIKRYSFSQSGNDATGMCCGGEAEVFMEVNAKPRRLIVFGGGHVGRELVKLASGSGFSITVADDRRDVLSGYGKGVTTVLADAGYVANIPSLDENCYLVIVTRSHESDRTILANVIGQCCAYVGMIGSKAKISKIFSSLEKSGVDRQLLDRVHSPVGLDIGAEGPYEIAVSIMAELIAARHGVL